MTPHYIELHDRVTGCRVSFNINQISDFADCIVETGKDSFKVKESYEQIRELIEHCGSMIARPDPRIDTKPLTWEQLTLVKMIGQPVWNSNTREWMLVIDSDGLNYWVELVNHAGGHEKWVEHDLQAKPLYRMKTP